MLRSKGLLRHKTPVKSMEADDEPCSGGRELSRRLGPGKRVLASTPPALPSADGALAITPSTSRREEAASCSGLGQKKCIMAKHHTRRNGAFKVPTIPKNKIRKPSTPAFIETTHESTPGQDTDTNDCSTVSSFDSDSNSPERSPRSDGQVEIAIPESCNDILNPDVSPGVISGPLDIGFLPDIELPDPLPLGVPTTEGFTQDFFQDWNPDAIRAEEKLPPRDATDIFLLQAAGDFGSTFMEEHGNTIVSGPPDMRFLPAIELPSPLPSFTPDFLHDWNPDAPTTEELPPWDTTHQEDSRQLFDKTGVAEERPVVPTEEETWGVDAEPNVFVHDTEYTLDDIFGPRTVLGQSNQTNVILFPLMAPSPGFDTSTPEPCSSSSSSHTLANDATDSPALTAASNIDVIPTVVNELSSEDAIEETQHASTLPPALNEREADPGTEEEEMPSPQDHSSTGVVVLARRSTLWHQEYPSSGTSGSLQNPPQGPSTDIVSNGGIRKKRGRPARVEPYNIPEVPSSSSGYSAAEVEAIKHKRAREQNKIASQKSRLKRAQKSKETEELVKRLKEKKEKLCKLELEKLEKIEKIKRFFKNRLDKREGGSCNICDKVLQKF